MGWLKEIDSSIKLLFVGVFLSVIVLIYVEHRFKDDGQVFQVIAGLVTGFSGALFTKLKSGSSNTSPPENTTITSVNQVSIPPKEDKSV